MIVEIFLDPLRGVSLEKTIFLWQLLYSQLLITFLSILLFINMQFILN